MEGDSPEICKICNKSMIVAKILPCAHSFCLECLESSIISKESSTCPTCQISFQIPVGGLKDLKTNEFVEKLKICREKLFACEGCTEGRAIKFCVECSYNYCSTCLEHHKKFPSTANHNLQELRTNLVKTLDEVHYPSCEEHSETINLYCDECNVSICIHCLRIKHSAHKIKHISENSHVVKNDMERELTNYEEFLAKVLNNHEITSNSLHANMLSASELKEKIHKRAEDVKNEVDSYVAELFKIVDEELEDIKKRAENVLEKLKDLEMESRAEIKLLNEKLKHWKYLNTNKTKSTLYKEWMIPEFTSDFNVFCYHDKNIDTISLKKITGTLHKDPIYRTMKMQMNREQTLDGKFWSIASNQNHIYLSRYRQIHTFDDEMILDSKYNFPSLLQGIYDLLSFDNNLIVLGNLRANTDIFKLFKIDITTKKKPLEIFDCSDLTINCNVISKSCDNNILVALNDEIIHLSEDGHINETIELSFSIDGAIQVDYRLYCCYNRDFGIFLVDELGDIIMKYSPFDTLNVAVNVVMACDDHGHIFLCNGSGNFLILDHSLDVISFHKIGQPIHQIHYDEDFDRLLFLTDSSPSELITYDL